MIHPYLNIATSVLFLRNQLGLAPGRESLVEKVLAVWLKSKEGLTRCGFYNTDEIFSRLSFKDQFESSEMHGDQLLDFLYQKRYLDHLPSASWGVDYIGRVFFILKVEVVDYDKQGRQIAKNKTVLRLTQLFPDSDELEQTGLEKPIFWDCEPFWTQVRGERRLVLGEEVSLQRMESLLGGERIEGYQSSGHPADRTEIKLQEIREQPSSQTASCLGKRKQPSVVSLPNLCKRVSMNWAGYVKRGSSL